MQVLHGSSYAVFAWDSVGFPMYTWWGLASPPPSGKIKTTLVVCPHLFHQLILKAYPYQFPDHYLLSKDNPY